MTGNAFTNNKGNIKVRTFSAVSTVQKLLNVYYLKIHYHHNEISFTVVLLISTFK